MKRTVNRACAIENTPLNIFVTLLTVLALTPAAQAGIVDSPLPVLQTGKATVLVYSVTGVINSSSLGTYFSCTSTSSSSQQVAVELFDTAGVNPVNSAAATQITLNSGQTAIFGTAFATGIFSDQFLMGPLMRGSARILSTSKSLVCTALLADKENSPPTSMVYLTIFAKTKQKGE